MNLTRCPNCGAWHDPAIKEAPPGGNYNLQAQAWISVNERLPEDKQYIIVAAGRKETWTLVAIGTYYGPNSWINGFTQGPLFRSDGGSIIHDITHWMPMNMPTHPLDAADERKDGK